MKFLYKIENKLKIYYMVLLLLPMLLLSILLFQKSKDIILENARNSVNHTLSLCVQDLDKMAGQIESSAMSISGDRKIYELLSGMQEGANILMLDRSFSELINRYFNQISFTFIPQLIDSNVLVGSNPLLINLEQFYSSELYKEFLDGGKKSRWTQRYDFIEMFDNEELARKAVFADRGYVTYIKTMSNYYFHEGTLNIFKGDTSSSLLLLSVPENELRKRIDAGINIPNARYYLLDPKERLILHNDKEGVYRIEDIIPMIDGKPRGIFDAEVNGNTLFIAHNTVQINGWSLVVVVPQAPLISQLSKSTLNYAMLLCILFLVLSILVASVVANRIVRPIHEIEKVMHKMGEGDFSRYIEVKGRDEIAFLAQKFNELNLRIHNLIVENYQVAIREKESQILALNMQMDPHFVYNTLNIVKCMIDEGNEQEAADMVLRISDMLRYIAKNTSELVLLKDELHWLEAYLYIMDKRFEGRFTVCFDIDAEAYQILVPKLFLQPFVENAILHGFDGVEEGIIYVAGSRYEGGWQFVVSDNGTGMTDLQIEQALGENSTSVGIYNTNKRIRLINGNEYGVKITSVPGQGTNVIIYLPDKREKQ